MVISMEALQAVVFDCDGVLVDTEPLHYKAYQEVLRPLGLGFDYERYLGHYIGFDDRDAFIEAFKEGGRELTRETLGSLIEDKSEVLFRIIESGVTSFPGVRELVLELSSAGVPLAIASGALRREIEAFLEALCLRGVFDIIVAADEVKKSKPDPETYLVALDRLAESKSISLTPGNCVALEDTPAGIASAKGAGLRVVAVGNSFPLERLGNADRVVARLDEIDGEGLARLVSGLR